MPVSDLEETLSLIETGRADEVLPTLEYLADLFPTSVTAHVLLARACESEHVWERALAEWQWAAVLMPTSPVANEGIERCVRKLSETVVSSNAPQPHRVAAAVPQEAEVLTLGGLASRTASVVQEEDEAVDEVVPVQSAVPPPAAGFQSRAGIAPQVDSDEAQGDLDRLIAELESARITPDPDFANALPPDVDDDTDDMVSETLARIYAAQRQYDEAARVYELLAAQHPGRAREFMKKATQMRSLAAEE